MPSRFILAIIICFGVCPVAFSQSVVNRAPTNGTAVSSFRSLLPAKPRVTFAVQATNAGGQENSHIYGWMRVIAGEQKYIPPPESGPANGVSDHSLEQDSDVVMMEEFVVTEDRLKTPDIKTTAPAGVHGFNNAEGGVFARSEGKRMTVEVLRINPNEGIRLFKMSW
ncbi:MAG: hypothetical protein LBM04_05680 [Opitutaceae bacterium]|jgi:hypothetical protein|nr:hypothetical protein [Opitutaceae bacterium]